MDSFETNLSANLYRLDCPDSLLLGEYQQGLLPDTAAGPIAAHVRACTHCAAELDTLRQFLADVQPAPGASMVERARTWIARRLPDLGETAVGQPAFAVRGDEAGTLMFAAGDAQLSLEIQADAETPGRKAILGLLFGVDTADLTAQLWQDEALAAETAVDDLGNFLFAGLTPGAYELILSGAELAIHVQELVI